MRRGHAVAVAVVGLAACQGVGSLDRAAGSLDPPSDDASSFDEGGSSSQEVRDATSADVTHADGDADGGVPFSCGTSDAGGGAALDAADTLVPYAVASGSRLVPRTIAESGSCGAEVPFDILDTTLGTTCAPLPYADGTIRCVPFANFTQTFYADPSCTQPVMLDPKAWPTPAGALASYDAAESSYFASGSGHACNVAVNFTSLARVGAPRAETTYYELDPSGPCLNRGAVPSSYVMRRLTSIPIDFVELREVRTRIWGAVAARELQGSDGSRLFVTNLYETDHGSPVVIDEKAPGPRLLPPAVSEQNGPSPLAGHLDAPPDGMATPAWCSSSDPMYAPPRSTDFPSFGCDVPTVATAADRSTTFPLELRTTQPRYTCGDGGVVAEDTPPMLVPDAATPVSEWPSVTTATLKMGARLEYRAWRIGGTSFAPPWYRWYGYSPSFWDNALGISCAARPAADGVLRCLPDSGGISGGITSPAIGYSDAACTARIVLWPYTNVPLPAYAFEYFGPTLDFPPGVNEAPLGTTAVFAIGAPLPANTTFYYRWTEGCAGPDTLQGWAAYEVGAPVAPTTFAKMELRNAP